MAALEEGPGPLAVISADTAISIMAVNSNAETKISTQLIKSGANINARDYQGHSVLEYAKVAKRTYLINLLKEKGAI